MNTNTTEVTLKFKMAHNYGYGDGYVAVTDAGTYHVYKTERSYSGIGCGTYTSWHARFTPTGGSYNEVTILIGNKYDPERFNSAIGETKRLAVFACNAHANQNV